jgi:hypothetical protein
MSLTKRQIGVGVRGQWSTRAASLLCVLLLSLLAFVQVAHVHPAASDADHCSICVAMHSAAPVAVVAAPVVFTTGISPVISARVKFSRGGDWVTADIPVHSEQNPHSTRT